VTHGSQSSERLAPVEQRSCAQPPPPLLLDADAPLALADEDAALDEATDEDAALDEALADEDAALDEVLTDEDAADWEDDAEGSPLPVEAGPLAPRPELADDTSPPAPWSPVSVDADPVAQATKANASVNPPALQTTLRPALIRASVSA